MTKNLNNVSKTIEKTDDKIKKNSENFEKTIEVGKNGTVTLPEVTLGNLSEALRFVRSQERSILSKMRESNEYVVNEVKEMLEDAFNGGYHSDQMTEREKGYTKSAVCSDYNYESGKRSFVEGPIKFLSEYEGSLQKFMDLVVEELKGREFGWGDSFNIMCKRFGVSKDELMNMDTVSFIEKMKKDIKDIPSLNPSTCCNHMNEHLGAAQFYLYAIGDACKKLGYKG